MRIRYGSGAVAVGRFLLALIFVLAGIQKIVGWNAELGFIASKGMPSPGFFLAAALVIELVGGLMLMFGIKARFAAVVLFLYLIPVSVVMHDFWNMNAPGTQAMMQDAFVHFLKNISIMGGLLAVVAYESLAARTRAIVDEERDEERAYESLRKSRSQASGEDETKVA